MTNIAQAIAAMAMATAATKGSLMVKVPNFDLDDGEARASGLTGSRAVRGWVRMAVSFRLNQVHAVCGRFRPK